MIEELFEEKPCDLDAEKSILNGMFFDKRTAEIAIENIREQDFSESKNRMFFKSALAVFPECSDGMDYIHMLDYLRRHHLVEMVGGMQYIKEIFDSHSSPANIERHCSIVREKASQRRLLEAADSIRRMVYGPATDDPIAARVMAVVEEAVADFAYEEPQDLQDLAEPLIDDAVNNPPRTVWGIPTNFAAGALDELTGGIHRKEFWVLAACPTMGKSTLIAAIARGVMQSNEGSPLIFSTEMAPKTIARASVAASAGVHSMGMVKRDLTDAQKCAVLRVKDSRLLSGIKAMYCGGMTVSELSMIASSHRRRHGLPLLVVDLVSGLKGSGAEESARLANILRSLKDLKEKLDCCIIACAHLNRSVHKDSQDHRPAMHHIRDSGEWEQHADRILFLHRESYYDPTKSNATEIIQIKDRHFGDRRSIFLEWDKRTGEYHQTIPDMPTPDFS